MKDLQGAFFTLFVLVTGMLLGLAAWPVAERFRILPAYCVIDSGTYDAFTAGQGGRGGKAG